MDRKELQKRLNRPYKEDNWKEIVQFVFPNVEILAKPKEFPISSDKIKRFRQLGSVRLNDGKNLALFELLLDDKVNLKRNRVELNEEISKWIDQNQIHGVLSVFEQGTDDYRFTFSAKSTEFDDEESDFIIKKTDTKKYTYLLGKNESCRTPAERFFSLSEDKSKINIKSIKNAFSVEELSKEFFDQYKKQFDKFWTYIAGSKGYSKLFLDADKDKQIRDFTKKLLGRIVFLHFLQKKGWLGCSADTEVWKDGDKQFMQNLFEAFENKSEFHSKCLSELFYNTLNRKRENNLFVCDGLDAPLNNSKIPYLNGGLFDTDEVESRKIDFPESYFQELFDFFGHYNFTIDENDPNEREVGIDPEMLGHIFENLLEDNKDKGTYYTPKAIVQYMCQESLIEYLCTKIYAANDTNKRGAIENLVRMKLPGDANTLEVIRPIAQALYDVKICDPAIGSGAFPMGILNEIFQIVEELWCLQPNLVSEIWNIDVEQWQPHLVKKNIIQRSIYGVDLESGAVDIARLRFWLALVVDEDEPLPLPNLDYKIMQGNSLLESFEGIDLSEIADAKAYESISDAKAQVDMFTGQVKTTSKIAVIQFEDIKTLMDEYFNANDPETKKDLHRRIDAQVLNHIRFTISHDKGELQNKISKLEKKLKLDEAAAATWQQKEKIKIESKTAKELDKAKKAFVKYVEKETGLAKLTNSNERPFFLWNLFFQKVLGAADSKDRGFDVIIGNPPYVEHKKLKHIASLLKPIYKVYTGSSDLSVYFFEKAFKILKPSGIFCYINTNKFFNTGYGKELRRFLTNRKINSIVNFEQVEVFEGILVSSVIFCATNRESNDNDSFSFSRFFKEKNWKLNFRKKIEDRSIQFKQSLFNEREWSFEKGVSLDIKLKIEAQGTPIKKIESIDIRRGVTTGYDPAFIIPLEDENKFIHTGVVKKLFKGKELKRYETKQENSVLLFLPWHFPLHEDESISGASEEAEKNLIENYPDLYQHLLSHKEGLLNRNQSETGVRYEWYCLQRCAASYSHLFEMEKIVWPLTADKWGFAIDAKKHYLTSGGFFMISKSIHLKYLLGFLNSKLMEFYFKQIGVMTAGGAYTLKKATIEDFPLIIIEDTARIEKIVDTILLKTGKKENTKMEEGMLDLIFYRLYKLTYAEVMEIDSSISSTISEEKYLDFLLEH